MYTATRIENRFPINLFWKYINQLQIPVESTSQLDARSAILVSKSGLLPRDVEYGSIQNCTSQHADVG